MPAALPLRSGISGGLNERLGTRATSHHGNSRMHPFTRRTAAAASRLFLLPVAFAAALMTLASCDSNKESADSRFAAIYTAEWKWRQEQFPDDEDSQGPIQDHLPKVDPDTQESRLRMWRDTLAKLDTIPREELSPAERLNYDVYRPQIQ